MAATFQGDPEAIANISSIQELQKKLPVELSEGTDPITLDRTTLTAALQEGEELLLSRLSALELRWESIPSTWFASGTLRTVLSTYPYRRLTIA
jgi:hypothetical protein